MLQQTQVATVIPYYRRFLRAFPTVERLAKAPLEKVLQIWAGMGYYRRARNLHRATQLIVERFRGRLPDDYRLTRSLPGVGDYTARAVLSIAYHQPYAALDGNIARVVARLRALEGGYDQVSFRRRVERELTPLLSRRKPGSTNQALMELGQTVCLPRAPRCPICPLRKWCMAYARKIPEAYPTRRPRRATELQHLAVGVVRSSGRIGLVHGLDQGLLADLWNFPSAFGRSRAQAKRRLRAKLAACARRPIALTGPLGHLRHRITHRAIRVYLYLVRARVKPQADGFRWFRASEFDQAATSKLAWKIAAQLPPPGVRAGADHLWAARHDGVGTRTLIQ